MSVGGCQREGVMIWPTMDSYCGSTPVVTGGGGGYVRGVCQRGAVT